MDRLISEERVLRVVRHIIRWMDCECDKSEVIKLVEDRIKVIPSAEPYKGMTNGEVIKTMFPHSRQKAKNGLFMQFIIDSFCYEFDMDWWNSLYKGEQK